MMLARRGRRRDARPGSLIYRTPFGRVVRAGVQNPDMVGALGISLEPYMMAIAALGVGLAGPCRRAARADRRRPSGDGRRRSSPPPSWWW